MAQRWHAIKKQNVFDDFIAAAEYLIAEKVTSSDKLAVMGGSNGGLLVGAVMTQRPELFKVALPAVGVLDMLRYHTFTSGAGWAYDYGKSDDNAEMFNYLLGYSPVHNVKAGAHYPATLSPPVIMMIALYRRIHLSLPLSYKPNKRAQIQP